MKQRFAQVSNPPIDHLRERLVMSLRTCLGPRRPLLTETAEAARLLELPTFFLYPDVLELFCDPSGSFPALRLDATFAVSDGPEGLRRGLDEVTDAGIAAVRAGTTVLVVSDEGISPDRAPIPSLLALGALDHRLVTERLRQECSIVVDVGDARDTHAVACLLGYGADAICPASRSGPSRPWPTTTGSASSSRPPPSPATKPRSRTASSRSCRRWASRPSTGTAARRSSRRSGSAPR